MLLMFILSLKFYTYEVLFLIFYHLFIVTDDTLYFICISIYIYIYIYIYIVNVHDIIIIIIILIYNY